MNNSDYLSLGVLMNEQLRNMEEQKIANTKKFALHGTIKDISVNGKKKPYDYLVETDDKKKFCCKKSTDFISYMEEVSVGSKVLLSCCRIMDGIIHVVKLFDDTEKNRNELNRYISHFNKNLKTAPHESLGEKAVEKRRLNLPDGFEKLPKDLQLNILDQMEAPEYDDDDIPISIEMDRSDYRLKYQLCKKTYSAEMRSVIEELLRSSHKRTNDKLKVAMVNTRYHAEKTTAEEARKQLDDVVFGMTKAKDQVCLAISASQRCPEVGLKILLVGPPGCGKTYFAQCIARIRKKPFFIAPCGSLNSLLDTSGDDSAYDASKPGFFGENIARIGTTDSTIVLDELDKVPTTYGKDGDPNACYINMLGDYSYYYDVFSASKVSCKSTWFIATANDERNIKPYILNRFDYVIHIDEYEDKDKALIAKTFILPNLYEKWNVKADTKLFSDEVLLHISRVYCFDYGCRDIKHNLELVLIKAIEFGWTETLSKVLTIEEIDSILYYEGLELSAEYIYKVNRDRFSRTDQKTIERLFVESRFIDDSALSIKVCKFFEKVEYFDAMQNGGTPILHGGGRLNQVLVFFNTGLNFFIGHKLISDHSPVLNPTAVPFSVELGNSEIEQFKQCVFIRECAFFSDFSETGIDAFNSVCGVHHLANGTAVIEKLLNMAEIALPDIHRSRVL